jgi:mono/diheme cytochrome c family protein
MNVGSKNFWTAAVLAALVAGCGGGGGSSTDGTKPPPAASTKTTIVKGAITGFGSVIVNGVRYDSDSATVRIEGKPGSVMDLKVGEVVRLVAEKDAQGVPRAKSIDQDDLIQGAVQAVDLTARTLTIAGQVIATDDGTSFDDSIPTRSLSGIAVGDWIEVHGFAGADGTARATRIEKADAGDIEVEVTGVVDAVDATNKRFTTGTLVVDYSTAVLEGFGSAGIAAGDLVELKGTSYLADGALKAVRVQKEDGDDEAQSGDESEIEGYVTSFDSPASFAVEGQKVTTTANTTFVNGSSSDLGPDVKVEVEGTFDANGVLVASKVSFRHESALKLTGAVESIDATAGTFTTLGVTVVVNQLTRREDHESDDHFFSVADLRTGDWVEVVGDLDPAGSGKVIATKLEREEGGDEVEVRGTASAVEAARLKVLGVTVELQASTEYERNDQPITAAEFLANADGKLVDVEGAWTGSAILADKVEIESAGGTVTPPPPPPPPPSGGVNQAPVAQPGTNRTVATGSTVVLDGSASSDPEGTALTFSWSLAVPGGSAASLTGAGTSKPSFVADVAGVYTATLTVSDGSLNSSASVTITAQAPAPAPDGAALYTQKCQGCHGAIKPIFSPNAKIAQKIQDAINVDKGGMGFLKTLTPEQVQAIAAAVAAANP